MFVDEATFQTGHAVRTIVWRPVGTAFNSQYIVPKAQSGRRSVSVFGLMTSRGLGPLIRINGRFDGENYVNILNEMVLPYIQNEFNFEQYYYYQDNSSVHRARIVREWFDDNIFPGQMIRTPAKSFDINPIENVWGIQKVKVARDGIYADEDELWLEISDAWNEIRDYDENLCHNLVGSIPRRLQNIIAVNGGHIKY